MEVGSRFSLNARYEIVDEGSEEVVFLSVIKGAVETIRSKTPIYLDPRQEVLAYGETVELGVKLTDGTTGTRIMDVLVAEPLTEEEMDALQVPDSMREAFGGDEFYDVNGDLVPSPRAA